MHLREGNIKDTGFIQRAERDEVFPAEVHAMVLELLNTIFLQS